MIPLPVILVEFLIALGLALFGASTVALVRLRRDGNWPPAPGRGGDTGAAAPSRARILGGIVVGLFVALWGLATWVTEGYQF